MTNRRALCSLAALLAAGLLGTGVPPASGADAQENGKKPSLTLKATPPIAFSPARVRVVAEFRGGADDYQQYYCPTIEWDWGDGTISENSIDCDPYEAGKSEIRRRFSAEHTYHQSGSYKVYFRLKQKTKTVVAGSVSVRIRPGIRETGGGLPQQR
jgi:hypothetical protein